jgi:hypothetical protein
MVNLYISMKINVSINPVNLASPSNQGQILPPPCRGACGQLAISPDGDRGLH